MKSTLDRVNKRASRNGLRAMVEEMEPRVLLSQAPTLDTGFGTHGYAQGYLARGVLSNGQIVASGDSGSLALLNPDGAFASNYTGPIPNSKQNVQSDGKYIVLNNPPAANNFIGSSDATITRHLPGGNVDHTFGINGTVSDFVNGTSAVSFDVRSVLASGTLTYVLGVANYAFNGQTYASPAIERVLPDGRIDRSFGYNGIAQEYVPPAPNYPLGGVFVEQEAVGPDGRVYLSYNADNDAVLVQFNSSGKWPGSMEIGGGSDHEVDGLLFEPNHTMLMLITEEGGWGLIALDTNSLPSDVAGAKGAFLALSPPNGMPDDWNALQSGATLARMWQRSDGKIIVGGRLTDLDNTSPRDDNFTFAVNPPQIPGAASVSGRVYNDINSNGKVDVKEQGLPWWQVYVDGNDNGVFDPGEPTAFSNKIGEYTLSNLPAGQSIIREVRQDSWMRTQPAGAWPGGFYSITLSANQQKTGLNFGNAIADHRTGSISGVVYNDYNGDQKQDNGEKGLAGWQIYADTNDNGLYDAGEPIATTNSAGQFTISGLQQGGYRIREVRKNGYLRTQPFGDWPLGYYDVVLAPAQNRSGFGFGNFAASAYGTIEGADYNDANGNGKFDAGERPLPGIGIQLSDESGPVAWATTDANGKFSFTHLFPGHHYQVQASLPRPLQQGIWISTVTNPVTVNLNGSQDFRTTFLAYDQPVGSIAGTVVDDNDFDGRRFTIYIDSNDDGKLDNGEQSFQTGLYSRSFQFIQLKADTYVLGLLPSPGWIQTDPTNGGALVVTLAAAQNVTGLKFTIKAT
jgi:hypothetical protein